MPIVIPSAYLYSSPCASYAPYMANYACKPTHCHRRASPATQLFHRDEKQHYQNKSPSLPCDILEFNDRYEIIVDMPGVRQVEQIVFNQDWRNNTATLKVLSEPIVIQRKSVSPFRTTIETLVDEEMPDYIPPPVKQESNEEHSHLADEKVVKQRAWKMPNDVAQKKATVSLQNGVATIVLLKR